MPVDVSTYYSYLSYKSLFTNPAPSIGHFWSSWYGVLSDFDLPLTYFDNHWSYYSRDMIDGGGYKIVGKVDRTGTFGSYQVRLYHSKDAHLLAETYSATDGSFTFDYLAYSYQGYVLVARDDTAMHLPAASVSHITPDLRTNSSPTYHRLALGLVPYGEAGTGEAPSTVQGTVLLDGLPAKADVYLIDFNGRTPVSSDISTGHYIFSDTGDHAVIPKTTNLMVVCHYGSGIQPITHGPVTPV